MFLKLLKHEFKSLGKWYLGLFALTFIGSILLGLLSKQTIQKLLMSGNYQYGYQYALLSALGFALVFIFAALAISNIVTIIRRFKGNIFGRQGYLTMTLPVSTHAIILSKLISALFLTCLTALNLLINVIIISSVATGGFDFSGFFSFMFELVEYASPLYLLSVIISYLSFILLVYISISLAHLAQNNHTLYAFLIYFGISFTGNILLSFIYLGFNINPYLYASDETVIISSITYNLILCLLSYFGTHYIIKNKLNIS